MIRKGLLALIVILLVSPVYAEKITHVIYITLDGVRWQDIYKTQHYFPKLWSKHASQLTFYGLPNSHTTMEVTSVPLSLPSYQAQMAGEVQPCRSNECGHIQVKTLAEYLVDELHFEKKDVAIFSSLRGMGNAIETQPGTTFSSIGNDPVIDPRTHQPDAIMRKLNHEQQIDHPLLTSNRQDKYTFSQALHYLEKYQPKFLWISLVNADDEADAGHKREYRRLLNYYDDAIDGLFSVLKTLHLEKSTMLIVTTDHGRGNKENWMKHGENYPESRQTWAFVMNGKLEPASETDEVAHYNTLAIRPAIEKVFY